MSDIWVNCWAPSHYDFDLYLPWACRQLSILTTINITKIRQSEYANEKINRTKSKQSKMNNMVCLLNNKTLNNETETDTEICDMIRITTMYDYKDNLIQLQFINNNAIPISILKVIGLIIKFQNNLTNIVINKGLTKGGVHELSKWITLTNITDLCLDDSVINDGNYESLLKSCLKKLSLSRCKIDDNILKRIASKMDTLNILKLSSNNITDAGAKYLAEILRTNRELAYLNLSDNNITDDGFTAILDILQEFPVREEEMLSTKSRYVSYIKGKTQVIAQLMKDLLAGNLEKTSLKSVKSLKKNAKSPSVITTTSAKKNKSNRSMVTLDDATSPKNVLWEDKIKDMAEKKVGKFEDPFCTENINLKNGQVYCYGNNNLAYINFAYNDISYVSVKRLRNVLVNQKVLDRNPRGLVNVSIEGNCLPQNCIEMDEICEILNENLELCFGKQKKKSRIVKSEPSILRSE